MKTDRATAAAIEFAAREAYGRLVARLAARSGDIALAEDALADALLAALEHWPRRGVPSQPAAWLLTVARNRSIDRHRRDHRFDQRAADLRLMADELADADAVFPDERLKLLFVCAHPAIDAAARTPLMLQSVLGLDAARIARALLVAPATMGQRLVRAKAKIRGAAIRFAVPDPQALADRLTFVLDAIYGAFGLAWDEEPGAVSAGTGMTEEAIFLARLVVDLLPEEPEAQGLLALMLFCEARRPARRDAAGGFVPLAEQDITLWSEPMMRQADMLLIAASRQGRFGRYQCEAAIQSAHVQRLWGRAAPPSALVTLYALLTQNAPSIGAFVGQASALLDDGQADAAIAVLDDLPAAQTCNHQPFWAVRAAIMARRGDDAATRFCAMRAIGLATDPAIRSYLAAQYSIHPSTPAD